MNKNELSPATEPTFYFIGVTTGKSSIMKVFPQWAKQLNLGECVIKGIDCKWHDEPSVYREVVSFIKNDPLSLGALVTTHKIDLLNAARDIFDGLDSNAELLGEISSISKKDGKLWGHAKDPITSGLSLKAFIPADHFKKTGAEICLLGAGGSSLALTAYMMQNMKTHEWPSCIHITNRSPKRLDEMKKIHAQINPGIKLEYYLCPEAKDNDNVVNRLKPGSLVINATGLGKDAPGSPVTPSAVFPINGFGWEFNYRGELIFLDQLRAQEKKQNLHVEDGWTYFLHGWTRVIAEVFHVDIPVSGPVFDALSETAKKVR
jgi:shikimate 5-dehydrogenase